MRTLSLLLGAAASATAMAAITLDGLTLDWDYRAARLLPTTSDRCRAAFRAKIDCPDTLLNLAASMRPVFEPTPADFALTCSATCKASLDNYLGDLMLDCNAPGDLTAMHTDGPRPGDLVPIEPERVWVVGWVLQYILARSCRLVDASKPSQYCYFDDPSGPANSKFDCADSCNVQLYTLMHDYPGFHWFFNYYALKKQSSWWEEYSVPGWERAVQCGAKSAVPKHATPPKDREVNAVSSASTSASASASGDVIPPASTAGTGAGSVAVPTGASGAAVTDVVKSQGGKVRNPFAGLW